MVHFNFLVILIINYREKSKKMVHFGVKSDHEPESRTDKVCEWQPKAAARI